MLIKPKIYIETTIPSYLTAWPSRDLIRAAHQQLTREWWEDRRSDFELYVSEIVILEAGSGDPIAAADRLKALDGIPILKAVPEAKGLSADLIRRVPLPPKAALDAVHIAIAVVNGMDFLLSWNCSHLANATLRSAIDEVCRSRGFLTTVICTPEQLLKEPRS
jgi:hypothetical protein